jgi:cyclin-dependent kinase 7
MGTPTEETWPGLTKLPDYVQFKTYPATPLEGIFSAAGPDLIDLMNRLLSLDPTKRCSCTEALKMQYFSNRPAPTPGPNLPMPSSLSNSDEKIDSMNPVVTGSKRKLREGVETSGLAKKLVF